MLSLPIVYEDDDLVVIDKPSGILTHRKNQFDHSKTVAEWLVARYPSVREIEADPLRPGIVHRLDKETSGLLVLAKHQDSFDYLKKLFQDRKIRKTYFALVHGHVKEKSGRIEIPLGKLGTLQSTRIHGKHELKEKEAVTEYRVVKEYPEYSLLEVSPLTGRTHQIRVHLKAIGHTVVCDRFYRSKELVCPPELGRLFLHAGTLSFTTPSGRALVVEAGLPSELQGFLDGIAQSGEIG